MTRRLAKIPCALFLFAGAVSFTNAQTTTPTPGPLDDALVQKGLQIAPVTLSLTGKDKNMVGYGSYLVNAIGGCNDCHTSPSYATGGDPFSGQAKKVNAAAYLAGGAAFGPFMSRNITPDATGAVAGSLANFKQIMKTGIDLKKLHPMMGPLLQVMPWPAFQDMADRDLEAMYAYLTAVPCLEGGPGELPNRCTASVKTAAVASPKNATVIASEAQLDGSQSTAGDGKALTFLWGIPPGSPSAAILRGATATPTVQFGTQKGTYTFVLTVTDTAGGTSTDTVSLNYVGR